MSFDAACISPEIRFEVQKLIHERSSSFEDKTIYRISVAAAPLATWVKANLRYSLVLEKIQPLKYELQVASEKLDSSSKRYDDGDYVRA